LALVELAHKTGEGEFLRAAAEAVPQILMEANVASCESTTSANVGS
jgi:hypothetical protein